VARLPYGDEVRDDPRTREVASAIAARRSGAVPNLYRMLLHAPELAEPWVALGSAVRTRAQLGTARTELLVCLVAALLDNAYEWSQHAPLARDAGWSEADLAAVADGDVEAVSDATARAALAYARELVRCDRASAATLSAARAALGDSVTAEVTAIVAYYRGLALLLTALEVDVDDDPDGPARPSEPARD